MDNQTSPFNLPQPRTATRVVTVRDEENQPGRQWEFKLRRMQAVGFHKAQSMRSVLNARYLTGMQGVKPIAFPAVGGEPVEISDDLFEQVSLVWAMQPDTMVPAVDDLDSIHTAAGAPWSCEEIIAMAATAPGAWAELLNERAAVMKAGNEQREPQTT
jgi:hypothetical protein